MRQGAGEMPLWHILPESRQVVRTCIPQKLPQLREWSAGVGCLLLAFCELKVFGLGHKKADTVKRQYLLFHLFPFSTHKPLKQLLLYLLQRNTHKITFLYMRMGNLQFREIYFFIAIQ